MSVSIASERIQMRIVNTYSTHSAHSSNLKQKNGIELKTWYNEWYKTSRSSVMRAISIIEAKAVPHERQLLLDQ